MQPRLSRIPRRCARSVLLHLAIESEGVLRLPLRTDAYRLTHAEADGLSGIVIDKFADVLVIEPFTAGVLSVGDWIENEFVNDGLTVGVTDGGTPTLGLWRKNFDAGIHTFSGNKAQGWGGTVGTSYVIFVTCQ